MLRNSGALQKQYAETQANIQVAGQYIPPTRRQQLEQQKAMLEHQLAVVSEAISALDAHPDLEEFAETLARAGV